MNAIHIELDSREITIQVIDGKLHISIPKECHCIIEHRDHGVPGVIGPGIVHNIDELTNNVLENCRDL